MGAQPPARGPRVVFSWLFPCARLYSAGISLYVWPSFRTLPPTSLSVDASFLPSLNVPHARLPQRPDAPPAFWIIPLPLTRIAYTLNTMALEPAGRLLTTSGK